MRLCTTKGYYHDNFYYPDVVVEYICAGRNLASETYVNPVVSGRWGTCDP